MLYHFHLVKGYKLLVKPFINSQRRTWKILLSIIFAELEAEGLAER